MPIGFRTAPMASVLTAINAMEAAAAPIIFLGISQLGHAGHRFHHRNPDATWCCAAAKAAANYHGEGPWAALPPAWPKAGLPAVG